MPRYTASDLAQRVGGALEGDGSLSLTGVAPLAEAGPGELSFVSEARYVDDWHQSRASAALVSSDVGLELNSDAGRALIVVDQADLAMAWALDLFAEPLPESGSGPGVHPTSVVDPTAELGADVEVGPFCHIGAHARIGASSVLHGSITIGSETALGEGCEVWPGTIIRERCRLGDRCVVHPNVVIGSDGFGYRPAQGEAGEKPHLAKMPHIGAVEIGSDVELGAGTCIDRGKFAATRLGYGCKIDNLVQIAHNCRFGEHVLVAGGCLFGGSVDVGHWCKIGGSVGVRDHVTLGDGLEIGGGSQVWHSITKPGRYAGSPARPVGQALKELAALRRLPDLVKRLRER